MRSDKQNYSNSFIQRKLKPGLLTVFLAGCIAAPTIVPEAFAADLYKSQLRSYSQIFEDQSARKKKALALNKDIARDQREYDKAVSRIRDLNVKARTRIEDMKRSEGRILELESEIQKLEKEAVALKDRFWTEQKDYADYQQKYDVLNKRQKKARKQIADLIKSRQKAQRFLDSIDQQRNFLSSEAEKIYDSLLHKQAEYEKISQSFK